MKKRIVDHASIQAWKIIQQIKMKTLSTYKAQLSF